MIILMMMIAIFIVNCDYYDDCNVDGCDEDDFVAGWRTGRRLCSVAKPE